MSNGTIGGQPLTKIPFGNRASVTEMIFDGVATTPRSNAGSQSTSGYSGVRLPGLCRRFQVAWKFPPGGPYSSVTLISNPNGLIDVGQITQRSIHVVLTPANIQACYWEAGQYYNTVAQQAAWSAPLAQDGQTVHHATVDVFQDGVFVFGPDGKHREIGVSGIGHYGGENTQVQSYAYQQADVPPIITAVAFEW